jgi:hypothetical protein
MDTDENTQEEPAEEFVEIHPKLSNALLDAICMSVHTTNAVLCAGIGDPIMEPWEKAPEWQRESCRQGVISVALNPLVAPSGNHDSWMAQKCGDGWKYGPVKDELLKEHPCMMAYDQLPAAQRAKDHMFIIMTKALLCHHGVLSEAVIN